MGLLEKALEYKKEINRKGKVTLLDTIAGPAETEMLDDNSNTDVPKNTMAEPEQEAGDDLFTLPDDNDYSPFNTIKAQKGEQVDVIDNEFLKTDFKTDNQNTEETATPQHELPDPLTAKDNPILPKDIDLVSAKKRDTANNGIPEIEPYIIPEERYKKTGLAANLKSKPAEETDPGEANGSENKVKYTGDIGNLPRSKYQENMTLYEIGKEISRSETKKSLFEAVIFSIMGQIGTSSASILIKSPENDKWIIVNSSGLKSGLKTFSFEASSGIFKIIKKDIIDIEKFRNDQNYNEHYKELASTGARLLIPWFFKGKVLGILALGNKITDEDYITEEKEFIQAICEASAIELNKINTIEKIKAENEFSRTGLDFTQRINNIQEKIILNNSIKKIKDFIISEFQELGINNFSIFLHDTVQDKYIPVIKGKNELHEAGLSIDETNVFIPFMKERVNNPRIEDFRHLEPIKAAFNEAEIKKMNLLWLYPVEVGRQLIGFTLIFDAGDELLNTDKETEINSNLDKLSKMTILNISNIISIDPEENKYADNIGKIFKRINTELANAKKLAIPLTLAVFSIKNYKRYGNLFGYAKAKELIDSFAELIKSRLSETDFASRYDRNKILLVCPGKDKKFCEPMANIIRNEFLQKFKKSEMQLLITFLMAEYPEDGNDLLSLVDSID
jgi:GGDEF domain-containing protein